MIPEEAFLFAPSEHFGGRRLQMFSWRVERASWWVMGGTLLLAMLGLFSEGWLSRATAASDDGGLVVEYERFVRAQYKTRIEIRARPAEDGTLTLWLSSEHLAAFTVEHMTPPPSRVVIGPQGQEWVFQVAPGTAQAVLTVHAQVEKAGVLRGRIGLAGHGTVDVRQWSYP